jgi:hypothetical protein
VNGSLYDVEFLDGTCIELFDGCDAPGRGHLAPTRLLGPFRGRTRANQRNSMRHLESPPRGSKT